MTTNTTNPPNKYRTAMEVLQRGRDQMVEEMAEQVIDQAEEFLEGSSYLFNEFLEGQGTKLHFLGLLLAQFEQSAEQQEEAEAQAAAAESSPPKRKRKPKTKKLPGQTSREGEPDEM